MTTQKVTKFVDGIRDMSTIQNHYSKGLPVPVNWSRIGISDKAIISY